MTEPVPLEDIDLTEVTLTRRIPVREHRAKGWRTRTVDHATESLINGATFPFDRVHHAVSYTHLTLPTNREV